MTPRLSMWFMAGNLLLAGGCGGETAPSKSASAPAPSAPKKPRIALVMKSLANEFFKTMAEGAEAHHREHASEYDLVVHGIKDERDVGRQTALMDEMIASGVDAIVLAPADSKALVAACRRAREAGVLVINIDNKLDPEVLASQNVSAPFVGPDNRTGAKAVGDQLAKALKKGDKVAVLEGVRTAFNAQQRTLGFQDAMKAAGVEIIDSQSAQWEMDQANKVASAMLISHPEIKALLCGNDSMALGALAAVRAAGKEKAVAIVGFDNISAVRPAIRAGSVLATADQHGDRLAVFGIEYALGQLKGGAAPADRPTPVDLVTAETLK